jgi:hypothetical protein
MKIGFAEPNHEAEVEQILVFQRAKVKGVMHPFQKRKNAAACFTNVLICTWVVTRLIGT